MSAIARARLRWGECRVIRGGKARQDDTRPRPPAAAQAVAVRKAA